MEDRELVEARPSGARPRTCPECGAVHPRRRSPAAELGLGLAALAALGLATIGLEALVDRIRRDRS